MVIYQSGFGACKAWLYYSPRIYVNYPLCKLTDSVLFVPMAYDNVY